MKVNEVLNLLRITRKIHPPFTMKAIQANAQFWTMKA
jgi:hypothetical protein